MKMIDFFRDGGPGWLSIKLFQGRDVRNAMRFGYRVHDYFLTRRFPA
jgi:hypothetical protein